METSMWAFMASWYTPTTLFCFMNLMIGAIFIASKTQNKPHQLSDHNSPQPARSASLLSRVKSINLSLYKFDHNYPSQSDTQFSDQVQENHQMERYDEDLDHDETRSRSETYHEAVPERDLDHHVIRSRTETSHEASPKKDLDHHLNRSRSETCHEAAPKRGPASEKAVATTVEEKEEEVDLRLPATVRERMLEESETTASNGDAGVDAKADDFIIRFKQQLKLQREDSLERYVEQRV